MNKLIISGYLGNDPKIYVTQSGKKQAKVSLSVKIGKDWKFVPLHGTERMVEMHHLQSSICTRKTM